MGKKVTTEEPQKGTKVAPKKEVAKKTIPVKNTKPAIASKKEEVSKKAAPSKTTKVVEKAVPVKKAAAIKAKVTIPEKKKTEDKPIVKSTAKKEVVLPKSNSITNNKKPLPTVTKQTTPAKTTKKEEPVKTVVTPKEEVPKATPVTAVKKPKKEVAPEPVRQAAPAADGKRKIIVDYKNVPDEVLRALSDKYPHGYNKGVIKFTNAKKELVSAVPIELDNTTYLVKISSQLQKMVNDYDEDDFFPDVVVPAEKEISVGAAADFDDFDKSDEDDSPKKKTKGKVKSADDLEYGFSDDDDDDDDMDDDDDDDASDVDGGDDDDE